MKGNGHGGPRQGSGRPPKVDEEKLIKLLTPFEDIALTKLEEGVGRGDYNFVKMYMEYRFGKPKQTIDANIAGELLINWFEQKTYDNPDEAKGVEGGD